MPLNPMHGNQTKQERRKCLHSPEGTELEEGEGRASPSFSRAGAQSVTPSQAELEVRTALAAEPQSWKSPREHLAQPRGLRITLFRNRAWQLS